MRVRKASYTKADGKGQRITRTARKWYASWQDWSVVMRKLPMFADRKASQELANKIDRMNSIRAAGDELPPELTRYVESMPPSVRRRLSEWGIISVARAAAAKPLTDHLMDYDSFLKARGRAQRYVLQAVNQVQRVCDECGWRFWSDLSASELDTWLNGLRDGEAAKADRTANGYLVAVKAFCRWMVKDGRASTSPVAHLDKRKELASYKRGPFTADEMRLLIQVTMEQPERFGMHGRERATLYRLAAETGFRAGELRAMTVSSFAVASDRPTATAVRGTTKNGRPRTVRLREDTARSLASLFERKLPVASAFTLPDSTHTAEMIRADMAAAGLAEYDTSGRKRDFHRLRHTTGTFFNAAGVNPKAAQAVLGHSSIELTMGIYTHTLRDDEEQAVAALPDLTAPRSQTERATGTGGAMVHPHPGLSPSLPPEGEILRSSAEFGGAKAAKPIWSKTPKDQGFSTENQGSGRGRIRTCEGRAIRFTV